MATCWIRRGPTAFCRLQPTVHFSVAMERCFDVPLSAMGKPDRDWNSQIVGARKHSEIEHAWRSARRAWQMPSLASHFITLEHQEVSRTTKQIAERNIKAMLSLVEYGDIDFFRPITEANIIYFVKNAKHNDDIMHTMDLVAIWYHSVAGTAHTMTGHRKDREALVRALVASIKQINKSDNEDGAFYSEEILKNLCDLYDVDSEGMELQKGDKIFDLLYESTVLEFFKQADELFLAIESNSKEAKQSEGHEPASFDQLQEYFQNVGEYLMLMSAEMH